MPPSEILCGSGIEIRAPRLGGKCFTEPFPSFWDYLSLLVTIGPDPPGCPTFWAFCCVQA